MTISLEGKKAPIEGALRALLAVKRGETPVSLEKLPGGANSIVYKAVTDRGSEYLVKAYILRPGDKRDRLNTEFEGLSFLWANGVRSIPEPICMDRESSIGVYGFVRGVKFRPGEITRGDVQKAASFLTSLHSLGRAKDAERQPTASEACFSLKAHVALVRGRIERLMNLPEREGAFAMLHEFLARELSPFMDMVESFARDEAGRRGIGFERELGRSERILSPSDFGFHNALRLEDGSIVFIDFEYYGWDDPAKAVADFYLQPAVPVPQALREQFLDRVNRFLNGSPSLSERLPLIYVILVVKWCLIMLNPFLHGLSKSIGGDFYIGRIEGARDKLRQTALELEAGAFPFSLYR